MIIRPVFALCLLASPALAQIPAGAELFTPPGLDGVLMVETADYGFTLSPTEGGTYVVAGHGPSGATISQALADDSPIDPDRLFLVESHGCGTRSIDLVIRLAPPENSEISQYSYYRFVMQPDLGATIAEFYDPSIAAANAVLPLQSVENLPEPLAGQYVTCDGSVPVVPDQ